jgi:hypothetical protein
LIFMLGIVYVVVTLIRGREKAPIPVLLDKG